MTPCYSHAGITLLVGDALAVLRSLPDGAARCCVTSPPYWGLRDYGVAGQLGLEATPDLYVARMVEVFREVRRVLADDGTLWLNLGDSYATQGGASTPQMGDAFAGRQRGKEVISKSKRMSRGAGRWGGGNNSGEGLKPKDLVGIPWRVAFALQADGWYLRSDIIWAKPNPMPESVRDRPTKSHEYLFLLSKQERYYYDAAAIAEPATSAEEARWDPGTNGLGGDDRKTGQTTRRFGQSGNTARKLGDERGRPGSHMGASVPWEGITRNARSVWTITTQPYPEAHFATFPEELPRRCILAGTAPGDTILDPFAGSGTTLAVAKEYNRRGIGIELNPAYAALTEKRLEQDVLDFGGVA